MMDTTAWAVYNSQLWRVAFSAHEILKYLIYFKVNTVSNGRVVAVRSILTKCGEFACESEGGWTRVMYPLLPLGQSSVAPVPTSPIRTVIQEHWIGAIRLSFTELPHLWSHRLNHSHTSSHTQNMFNHLKKEELTHSFFDPMVIMLIVYVCVGADSPPFL